MPLIRKGGRVLDLAVGGGRHTRLLLEHGYHVLAVDRDVTGLADLAGTPGLEIVERDLEDGRLWSLGAGFDGILVTNYLHRPLFADLAGSLAPGGLLLYETFALGNERFGRPSNPDFLLHPGELLEACVGLAVIAFEQGVIEQPKPAVVQRIAARRGAPLEAPLPPGDA
jgi:SAM-dependent methyltransferase